MKKFWLMKIEDYIKKKRKELDVERVDEEILWSGISSSIKKKKHFDFTIIWKIAASILVVIALTIIVKDQYFTQEKPALIFVNIDPELAKKEAQYVDIINAYYKDFRKVNLNSELATDVSQIEEIDKLINEYSKDLEHYGPNPTILNTLMDLYEKKIRIFDRMLNEIKKQKSHEKKESSL